jgi:hypothetical protein
MVAMHGSILSILPDAIEITGVGAHIHPYILGRYNSEVDRRHPTGP